jgi:PAS domain S-box-containing protein
MQKFSNYLTLRVIIFVGILLFIFLTISSYISEERMKTELKNNLQIVHKTKISAGNFILNNDKPVNISKIISSATSNLLSAGYDCENKDFDKEDCVILKTNINKDYFDNSVKSEYIDIAIFSATGSRIFFSGIKSQASFTPKILTPRPSQNKNFTISNNSKNTYIGKSGTTASGNMLIAFEFIENGKYLGSMTFIVTQTAFSVLGDSADINITSYALDATGDVRPLDNKSQKIKSASNEVIDSCKNNQNKVFEYKKDKQAVIAIASYVQDLNLCIVTESNTIKSILLGNSTYKTNYLMLLISLLISYFSLKLFFRKTANDIKKINKKGESALLGKFDLPENKIKTNIEEMNNLDRTFDFILHKFNSEKLFEENEDKLQQNILIKEKSISTEALSSREKFREAVEAAQDIIVLLNLNGVITYANKALKTVTGFSLEAVEGKSPFSTWHDISGEISFKENLDKVSKAKESIILHLQSKKIDGAMYESEVKLSPIIDVGTGLTSSILMVERDITDEKQKERVKNEFISVVSHELRTPMTIIRGYSSLLADGKLGDLNTKQKEYMERINVETGRLLDLANDMLDLQKFDAGKAELHTERTNVKDVAIELTNEFEPLFAKKGLKLTMEDSSTNPFAMIDKRYLNRAFTNLIQNALKFTEKGGVTVYTINPDDKHIVIAFKDTGVGIAEEAIPHLFSKFYQASNVLNRKQEGSGLGLSIVKKIIEAHKGLIWVESTEGTGSTFYIALPI